MRIVCASVLAFLAIGAAFAAERGIEITPDDNSVFAYEDDFETPRVLQEAFLTRTGPEVWTPGSLVTNGPHRSRTVTYRFHGTRAITAFQVEASQYAAHNLGGRNYLYLSSNGVDWDCIADSADIEVVNHRQTGPLSATSETSAPYLGHTEFWVRLVLDNYSGLKTAQSGAFSGLKVTLTMAKDEAEAIDPQAKLRKAWGDLRAATGWKGITLDWRDPVDQRAPHYCEDVDGWLVRAGHDPRLASDEHAGMRIWKHIDMQRRPVTGLGVFIRTTQTPTPMMVRLTVLASEDGHRKLRVLWDGAELGVFDAASFLNADRDLFLQLPASKAGVHELRITGEDEGSALIRAIAAIGDGIAGWAERPPLPAGGSLEVLSAYYMPDPAPPAQSQTVEGRKKPDMGDVSPGVGLTFKGMQRLYQEHADFGALRLVVRNNGSVPTRITGPVLLNGAPIEDSYVDFVKSDWDARGVVWYRVNPRALQPGECAQTYIRFRRRPEGDAAQVSLPLENGPALAVKIPYLQPANAIDYVVASKDLKTLYIYARKQAEGAISPAAGLTFDGQPVPDAAIYGAGYPGGVALAVAQFDTPLTLGAYHVAGIRDAGGAHVAARFRVLPFIYPRSSVHTPSQMCKPMHMNLGSWHQRPLQDCLDHEILTTTMHHSVFSAHERVAYIIGPDEPDAKDNAGGGYDKGLGLNARRLADSGWQELVERFMAPIPSWLNMDGTVRPLNWSVYGQMSDINGFDPYPVTYYGADHAYIRESLSLARQSSAPTPMFAFLETYGWGAGQGVPKEARGPLPAEYRQNVVQAIGVGMKGLSSWVYARVAGGWELNPEFAKEITKLNQLIEHIQDELILGTPIDAARTNAGQVLTGTVGQEFWEKDRVWAGCLLCGPDSLVVTVANHIPASKPEPPVIEPARNVEVSVKLPPYLQKIKAFEVTEHGVSPYGCEVENGIATLMLDAVESGRVLLLRGVK